METSLQNILLLHGALGSEKSFEALSTHLKVSFNVYTFDFIGHGTNSHDKEISAELLCNQLITFIEKNHLEGIAVFGYSMGGYIALLACSNRPELFGKISTLATKYDWNDAITQNELKQLDALHNLDVNHPFIHQLKEFHGAFNYTNCINLTGQLMLELGKYQPLHAKRFAKINNKVLLLIGASDKMVSIEETREVAKHLQQAEMKVLPDTRHPLDKVDLHLLTEEITQYVLS